MKKLALTLTIVFILIFTLPTSQIALAAGCTHWLTVGDGWVNNGSLGEIRVCQLCGYTETRGHTPYSWYVSLANPQAFCDRSEVCEYGGYKRTKCETCTMDDWSDLIPAGHNYIYKWVYVKTVLMCKKRVGTCSYCLGSYVYSYDPIHAYTNNCVSTTCNECGYVRVAPGHTTPSSWSSYNNSSYHRKCCATCGVQLATQSHTWQYVGNGYLCTACGQRK